MSSFAAINEERYFKVIFMNRKARVYCTKHIEMEFDLAQVSMLRSTAWTIAKG